MSEIGSAVKCVYEQPTDLAGCWQVHSKTGGEAQEWVRAMLGTVGRGGNAQAVRDEILNIMHRNNIGEKKGTWMEVSNMTGRSTWA